MAGRLAEYPLRAQLADILEETHNVSTGGRAYREWGIRGIRGEVIEGFPSILQQGLPALREALQQGADLRTALIHCLLSLMAVVQDTTLLNRNFDRARIDYTQASALAALDRGVCSPLKAEPTSATWRRTSVSVPYLPADQPICWP